MMRRMPPLVHVTSAMPEPVQAALERDFRLLDGPAGAEGLLTTFADRVDAGFLDAAGPQLRVVANFGVGVDNVDLDTARGRGIVVANTPDVLTRATAELTIALMLALLRRVAEGDRLIRRGDSWHPSPTFLLGEELDGKTLGIVGAGRIGRETGRLGAALGMRVVTVGRNDPLVPLLEAADVVSLHVPLTPATRHLIDSATLRRMRTTAVLVNTARGAVVDETALVDALRAGEIAGAALDVYETEPVVRGELLRFENVVLAPHIGSATHRTREAMGMLCVDALRAVLIEGRRPANAVV
jgi:glyoxylate reductase